MPSQKNLQSLSEIKSSLSTAKAIILANYAGLSVADQTSLRAKIAASGGDYVVAKNNLLKIALEEKLGNLPSDVADVLRGPTAVVFAQTDVVTATKAIVEFAKDKNLPEIKIGMMLGQRSLGGVGDDKILSIKEIDTLSKLPSREQLLSSLLAQMSAPAEALVRQINAPIQLLAYALEAITHK